MKTQYLYEVYVELPGGTWMLIATCELAEYAIRLAGYLLDAQVSGPSEVRVMKRVRLDTPAQ